MSNAKIGDRFSRWVVVGLRKDMPYLCEVMCDCGNTGTVIVHNLVNGRSKSCGCLRAELHKSRYKHVKRLPEYGVWRSMITRCENPKQKSYPRYGGRGISVCERWRNGDGSKTGFECFIGDMGKRPSAEYSIERIDNAGNYEPSNCKWATRLEQGKNIRTNHYVIYQGEKMILADAIRKAGLAPKLVDNRLRRGWTIERALSVPAEDYDQARCIMVNINGEDVCLKSAAKMSGVKYHTAYARVKAGWPVEKALNL